MTPSVLFFAVTLVAAAVRVEGTPAAAASVRQEAPVNADAHTMAEFTKRIEAYTALHKKIESSLPKLPDKATPTQIDTNQRAFAAQLAAARTGARQGDLFTPEMQMLVRKLMTGLFKTSAARGQLRESVMDENPVNVKVAVNGRYPDAVPLSTMPPEILKSLPLLPEELEYRFVGETLILLDPHAHIVADFVTRALPR